MAREMKDSGVSWIGEIPTDWDMVPLQYYVELNKNTLEEDTPSDYEFEYVEIGAVTLEKGISEYQHYKFSDAPSRARRIVKPDDIIVSTVRTYLKAIAIVPDKENVVVSTGFAVLTPKNICTDYLGFTLKSEYFVHMVTSRSVGISYPAINSSDLVKIKIPIPTAKEQEDIADYLNKECAEIDAILEKVRSSIEEYKKLKQAIITQAVTKGICGDRPMKDSGIEWVKQLPLEWHSINPKALFTQRKDRAKEGEKQLTASQQYGVIYQDEYMELTGTRVVTVQKDFDILKHVEAGDFVISMRSFQGGLEYSTRSGSISSAYVMLCPNLELVYPRFFRWLLKSQLYINALQSTSDLVRDGQAMRYSNFAQVRLYTVPMEEQKEIADYLDRKCAKIDALIEQKSKFLSELEAYKKSLIYEYITGKKEAPQAYSEPVIAFIDARVLLMCRIIELLKPKGRIHLMKALFCVDCLLDLNRETQYLRQKHGPYDERIEEYEEVLIQKGWISIQGGSPVDYVLTETFETYRNAYQFYYGNVDDEIKRICAFLRPMNTSQAERVATLLAVWNDFIIDGIVPTDKQIVQEVRSNWTPNKAHSPEPTWMDTLAKMRKNQIVPSGYGKHSAHMTKERRGTDDGVD